jgi:hypothetical protein
MTSFATSAEWTGEISMDVDEPTSTRIMARRSMSANARLGCPPPAVNFSAGSSATEMRNGPPKKRFQSLVTKVITANKNLKSSLDERSETIRNINRFAQTIAAKSQRKDAIKARREIKHDSHGRSMLPAYAEDVAAPRSFADLVSSLMPEIRETRQAVSSLSDLLGDTSIQESGTTQESEAIQATDDNNMDF